MVTILYCVFLIQLRTKVCVLLESSRPHHTSLLAVPALMPHLASWSHDLLPQLLFLTNTQCAHISACVCKLFLVPNFALACSLTSFRSLLNCHFTDDA